MPSELARVLMERDKISESEAEDLINEMKELVLDGEDPEEVLLDHVGLEPDYIFDII